MGKIYANFSGEIVTSSSVLDHRVDVPLLFFYDNYRTISAKLSIKVSVCSGSYDEYFKTQRNNQMCDPWDSQGNEKMQFLFPLLLAWMY